MIEGFNKARFQDHFPAFAGVDVGVQCASANIHSLSPPDALPENQWCFDGVSSFGPFVPQSEAINTGGS